MFKFLRNKVLTAFMIIGALTQTAQTREVDHTHPSTKSSQFWKTDEEFLRDFTEEAIRAAQEEPPLTLHGMAVEKMELERLISFEFAARYQEAAEHSMITGDKTALRKIRQERDEILERKQKEWDEGTFDKVAEAKRWAEYIRRRAIDQRLVLYPIDVGQPPFPIDMSILSSQKEDTPASFNSETVQATGVATSTREQVEELLRELKPTVPQDPLDQEVAKVVLDTFSSLSDDSSAPGVAEYEDVIASNQDVSTANVQTTAPKKTEVASRSIDTGKDAELDPEVAKLSLEIFSSLSNDKDGTIPYSIAQNKSVNESRPSSVDDVITKNDTLNPEVARVSLNIFSDGESELGKEQVVTHKKGRSGQPDLDALLDAIEEEEKQAQVAATVQKDPVVETPVSVPVEVVQSAPQSQVESIDTVSLENKGEKKRYVQKDLEDLLTDLEEEEKQNRVAVVSNTRPVETVEHTSHEAVSSSPTTQNQNISAQETEKDGLKELLAQLDKDVAGRLPTNDTYTVESSTVAKSSIQEINQALNDIDQMFAKETKRQETATPSTAPVPEVSTPVAPVAVAEKTIQVSAPVAQSKSSSGQKDLDDLLASIGEENRQTETTSTEPSVTETVAQAAPVVASVETSIPAVQQKVTARSTRDDIEELLGLDVNKPADSEKKDSSLPLETIAWVGLGVLAAGALKRPNVDKLRGWDEIGSYPLGDILGPLPEKQETPVETAQTSQNPEKVVTDPTPGVTPSVAPLAADMQIRPISHDEDMKQDERDFLAQRLHAVRTMEDIKRERYKLTRQMAKAKANNDTEQIQNIESCRQALKALRKEAFETAAGPLLGKIREERRLLTKKMTLARRKKDAILMAEIKKRRAFLTLQEQVLKSTVREFKYKASRPTFLKPKVVSTMKQTVWKKKTEQRVRS